ncbi:hypothetical protein L2E82_30477 [Cichorium intybus]|uniref:Uncharacterized protein n=1 Tax=Cichorium intybus TaxID=13427 RepID=A0ACB9D0U5_CICIN|nr:hypothetical protein L2E82_30477 [Cichorium intybus]
MGGSYLELTIFDDTISSQPSPTIQDLSRSLLPVFVEVSLIKVIRKESVVEMYLSMEDKARTFFLMSDTHLLRFTLLHCRPLPSRRPSLASTSLFPPSYIIWGFGKIPPHTSLDKVTSIIHGLKILYDEKLEDLEVAYHYNDFVAPLACKY